MCHVEGYKLWYADNIGFASLFLWSLFPLLVLLLELCDNPPHIIIEIALGLLFYRLRNAVIGFRNAPCNSGNCVTISAD